MHWVDRAQPTVHLACKELGIVRRRQQALLGRVIRLRFIAFTPALALQQINKARLPRR